MAIEHDAPAVAGRDEDLESQAQPLIAKEPVKADFPLPPAELVDQLDNSGTAPADDDAADDELVTLDFVGDELPHRTFPLKYPFRWAGSRVDSVTVRQLTTAEVGRIAQDMARGGKSQDLYEIYAAMAGLPARVLRLMPSVDGEPIVDAAYGFLPRLFLPADG